MPPRPRLWACQNCRARKMRCTGVSVGGRCDACRNWRIECTPATKSGWLGSSWSSAPKEEDSTDDALENPEPNLWSVSNKTVLKPSATGTTTLAVVFDSQATSSESSLTSDPNLVGSTSTQITTPIVGGTMVASDVVSCLVQHGCRDITESLDSSTCTQHPISTGGFGDIYQGNLKDGRTIAIKCMRILIDSADGQKHLKYAAREIHTWSKCEHRHVLQLLGLVQFRGQIGMVSPWVTHGSLNHYLTRNPEADRLNLCMQVADGLAYLHQCGVVHGDLKGANVLVSDDGDALLTDFGNAVLQERTLQFTYTTAKTHLSPRWTAPELIRGEGSFSVKTDVFALGMTMLETITGSVPYRRLNDFGVMYAIVEGRIPERPEDTIPTGSQQSDSLWDLLVSCWVRTPESRPTVWEVWDTVHGLSIADISNFIS